MITEDKNNKYSELEHNLNKILSRDKAQKEAERLKREESGGEKEFDKDEFIYQIQGQISVLDEREKRIERMSRSTDEEPPKLYPDELDNFTLETIYISLLYGTPNAISKFYFEEDICFFSSEIILNLYKSVIFKEGEKHAPPQLKDKFNFPKAISELYDIKCLMQTAPLDKKYNFELIYRELKKLFILKKAYIKAPTHNIQEKILEIKSYIKYKDMSAEEVEAAIKQINVTNRLSQAVLNHDIAKFWLDDQNDLREGIPLPFPIMTKVFKGLRKGEIMTYAMPSNAGKSRFTVNLACNIAFHHKKKVLVVSNEMTEDKMRLCLLTTVINNPVFQQFHGQKLIKNEGELLEFKFKADNPKEILLDEQGFIKKLDNETQAQFIQRLSQISTEFNQIIKVTDWINQEINNS